MAFDLTQRTQLVRDDGSVNVPLIRKIKADLLPREALVKLRDAARYGSFMDIRYHDEHTRWLRDMGYIKFTHNLLPTIEGGTASWRKSARRKHGIRRRYAVTPLGIERLTREGFFATPRTAE